jgi:hypothetical protein
MFNVAQRGAGPWTTLAFTVDRWSLALNLDTTTAAQFAVADADRTQLGDEQFTYCMNVAVTGNAGAAAYSELTQRIEGVRRLAGKTVILSFYGRYTAGTPKIGIGLWQNFGTGGSPSANVFMTGQPVTIIGTWARYSVTFAVPSAVGKTLGTAGDDSTAIEFWFSSGTTQANRAGNIGVQSGTFQLWGVQLEIAQPGQTQPTPLEKPDPVQQLQQCQRFYTTGFCYCIGTPGAGAFIGCTVSFNTTMRAYPSIAFTGTTYTNASAIAVGGGGDAHSFGVYVTATAAGPANFTSVYTASADL